MHLPSSAAGVVSKVSKALVPAFCLAGALGAVSAACQAHQACQKSEQRGFAPAVSPSGATARGRASAAAKWGLLQNAVEEGELQAFTCQHQQFALRTGYCSTHACCSRHAGGRLHCRRADISPARANMALLTPRSAACGGPRMPETHTNS